jgi:hypothetical protein
MMVRLVGQRKCYWKSVSQSYSLEGAAFRSIHPEIPFQTCTYSCKGLNSNCEHFEIREVDLLTLSASRVPQDEEALDAHLQTQMESLDCLNSQVGWE